MTALKTGLTHTSSMLVDNGQTASAMGSGDLNVLATPALLALMENAALLAVANALTDGITTVGAHIESSHLRPTPCGHKVSATAVLTHIDGRKLLFKISATDDEGNLIAEGTHLRFMVDRAKFLSAL
jgi:fluoroacetyl-CoA thioesterase